MKSELWRVPAGGGVPQKIDYPETKMMMLRMNPDVKTIAFGAGKPEKTGVWILEKCLPNGDRHAVYLISPQEEWQF